VSRRIIAIGTEWQRARNGIDEHGVVNPRCSEISERPGETVRRQFRFASAAEETDPVCAVWLQSYLYTHLYAINDTDTL
jgi:hypothetical protein